LFPKKYQVLNLKIMYSGKIYRWRWRPQSWLNYWGGTRRN